MIPPEVLEAVAHERSKQTAIVGFVAIVALALSMLRPEIGLWAAVIVGQMVGVLALNRWVERPPFTCPAPPQRQLDQVDAACAEIEAEIDELEVDDVATAEARVATIWDHVSSAKDALKR